MAHNNAANVWGTYVGIYVCAYHMLPVEIIIVIKIWLAVFVLLPAIRIIDVSGSVFIIVIVVIVVVASATIFAMFCRWLRSNKNKHWFNLTAPICIDERVNIAKARQHRSTPGNNMLRRLTEPLSKTNKSHVSLVVSVVISWLLEKNLAAKKQTNNLKKKNNEKFTQRNRLWWETVAGVKPVNGLE